jgi:hypothetical protein
MFPLTPYPIVWQNTMKMQLCDVSVDTLPHHLAKCHEDAVMCCFLLPSYPIIWQNAMKMQLCDASVAILSHHLAKYHEDAVM